MELPEYQQKGSQTKEQEPASGEATAGTTLTTFHLYLRLPAELRLMICRYLLRHAKAKVHIVLDYDPDHPDNKMLSPPTTTHSHGYLLYISREFYWDIVDVYWDFATVTAEKRVDVLQATQFASLPMSTFHKAVDLRVLKRGLPPFSIPRIPHLRNVILPAKRKWIEIADGEAPTTSYPRRYVLTAEAEDDSLQAAAVLEPFRKLRTVVFATNPKTDGLNAAQILFNVIETVKDLTEFDFSIKFEERRGSPTTFYAPRDWLELHYGLDWHWFEKRAPGVVHFITQGVKTVQPSPYLRVMGLENYANMLLSQGVPRYIYLNYVMGMAFRSDECIDNNQEIMRNILNWKPPSKEPGHDLTSTTTSSQGPSNSGSPTPAPQVL